MRVTAARRAVCVLGRTMFRGAAFMTHSQLPAIPPCPPIAALHAHGDTGSMA